MKRLLHGVILPASSALQRRTNASAPAAKASFLPPPASEAVATTNGVTMTYLQSINSALDLALAKEKTVLFGEDVAFGGVFRCSTGLKDKHGPAKVFDSPLTEQGVVAFAIGMALVGWRPIAEIQFADYIFPAFDQFVNEASAMRFRTGGKYSCGITVRAPCSSVGHGGLYHSQTVEGYFNHAPGIKIVMPSTPSEAKGLLLQCVMDNDPCLFLEPKALYRSTVEEVNPDYYTLPLGVGRVLHEGTDLTIVAYGTQVNVAAEAIQMAKKDGISVELIDLRTIKPWDRELVAESVRKTGRLIVTHEAPKTSGFGAEVISAMLEDCFFSLQSKPRRVCGLNTPHPLHEKLYLPNKFKIYDAIKSCMDE